MTIAQPSVTLMPTAGDWTAWTAANRRMIHLGIAFARAVLRGGDGSVPRAAFDEARAAVSETGQESVLDRVSRIFALTPADEDILIFALAHRIDGAIAGLCAEAAGDARQSFVTAHLLTIAIGGGVPDFAAALLERLTPEAPLRRNALIEVSETHALAAITVAESMAARLAGQLPDLAARPGLSMIAAVPGTERIDSLARRLGKRLVAGDVQGLALIGPPGCGRRAAAQAAAEYAGLRAVLLDAATLPAAADTRERAIREIARDARLDGLLPVIDVDPRGASRVAVAADESAIVAAEASAGRALAALAARYCTPLIILASEPTGLPTDMVLERMEPLTTAERVQVWRAALSPLAEHHMAEADRVAHHFPFGPSEIAGIASMLGQPEAPGALWNVCRMRGAQGLEQLAERVPPRFTWHDLVLPAPILDDLRAIADQVRYRATVYEDWGFAQRLSGGGRGIAALFAGPSGVGKTMAAEVIANDLELDLYRVDLSRLVSKYIGETEKNLRRVFDAAEESGVCLFLDEADAVLGKRSEVKDSHDRHANIEVSYLLQRMESYSGLCLMATNLKNNLDAAFLRRLRFVVDIPFPDQAHRYRIWERAFPADTPTEGLDLAALSRLDITGGSIVVIAVNAAFLAAAEGGSVTMERIARAARGEYRKHDRNFRATW